MNKTIITVTACLISFQVSIWWAWGTYRRPADDIVKINQSLPVSHAEENCIKAGGMPSYYEGQFNACTSK